MQSPCDPAGDHRCAHHDFDYPLEFARSRADLFYALRDARNNLKVVVPSDHVPLSVVADQDSVVHSAGQQMILTIINTLLRCGRRFASLSVDIPDAPLCTTVAGIAATTLRGAVLELTKPKGKVDPHSRIVDSQKDYGFAIVIGNRRCAAPNRVYIGVDDTDERRANALERRRRKR
ncbi:MAG: hypothetical protein DMG69_08035 [Acidobacteria bacterium]|nr:MAG: hypothetical protein DMG69_08035 [Acidobacteriota bacterium]